MEKSSCHDPARPEMGTGPAARKITAKDGEGGPDEGEAAGSRGFGHACIGRWLTVEHRQELHRVVRLTGPLLLSRILNFLLKFTTTIFCGHIGNSELAGYALASATLNLTTVATGLGLVVACDTLISQTFGSKNMKQVGVILQRSLLIVLLFCLPCWALLINSYNILILLHQKEQVARIAHLYVMIFLPAVPAMFLHHLLVAYLQNQGITLPQMYTAAVANIFNLVANYVLIFSLQLGVTGSAIANSLSEIVICLLLFGYIRWKNLYHKTWGGWSTECLQEWGSHMKLAIPSMLMVCFEWWFWEVGSFLSGVLGEVDLAAQHVIIEIGAIMYMIPLGINAAASVCIGNELGAGNTAKAKLICKVVLGLAGTLAVAQSIAIFSSKSVLGYIFTSDENIVEIVSENLTVYSFVQFFDALLCTSTGIFIGSGMQAVVALSNLVTYYVIGLPVGIALMFAAKMRTVGLWLGLLISTFLQVGLFLGLLYKLNWKKVTHEAQKRTGQRDAAALKCPFSVNEALVPDNSTHQNTANSDGLEAPTAGAYSLVNRQDLKPDHEEEEGNCAASGRTAPDAESSKGKSSKAPELLSLSQLVLRRGLTLLILVLILSTGVAFHFAFPVPEPTIVAETNGTLVQDYNSTSSPLILMDFALNP
ncbi:multidrug and toxin extrusion protein 1-like [Takifugu rubripes]|uniref:Multidrug and toxin extrusion protein n=1 Tax=Takifugu rubripes TaxID=31033 RepID=H2RJH8_TAKRU|nr:multidrug and toxin extrusion protein 1-like [Takifugu rubripes]